MNVNGLQVRDLHAGYGEVPVVRGVSLAAAPGEIVALLGRNGAGKTTTLWAIAGLLRGTTGEVCIDGVTLTGAPHRRARKDIGLVLEGRSVFPSLTTTQNLELAGVNVDAAVALFPTLGSRLGVRAGLLSGGEQQMLSLARAVCRRPRVLLIDELSFGLAPTVCEDLFQRLAAETASSQMAVVLVEQHIHYAAQLASTVYILGEGTIALQLRGSELLSREEEIERIYLGGAGVSDPPLDATQTV